MSTTGEMSDCGRVSVGLPAMQQVAFAIVFVECSA
jgi:hypothetical protein